MALTAEAAMLDARRPDLAMNPDFALVPDARPGTKPTVYRSAEDLARRIHRERAGQALQLKDDRLLVRSEPAPRRVVAVYGLDQVGGRTRFIGYAWLKGQGREALQAALEAVQPMAGRVG